MSTLELLRSAAYDRAALRPALDAALQRTGILARLRDRGARVLLKPNFVMPAPRGDTSTTHPDFYMALAELLLAHGFTVGIGESPAFGSCARALAAHGVLDECRGLGIEVVEFRTVVRYAGVAEDRHYRTLSVAAELRDWDSLVNVPKLKTHRQFVFTGAVKNLYGCVVGKRKFIRHNLCGNDPLRFARMLIANAGAVDCVAHVADGIEAMHVVGPRGGEAYPLGVIALADAPLALDWAFCRLIGLRPESTPLFATVPPPARAALETAAGAAMAAAGLQPVDDFVHAPLIHISFSPLAMARSGLRTLGYKLSGPKGL